MKSTNLHTEKTGLEKIFSFFEGSDFLACGWSVQTVFIVCCLCIVFFSIYNDSFLIKT